MDAPTFLFFGDPRCQAKLVAKEFDRFPADGGKKESDVATMSELEEKRLLVQAAGKKIKGETSRLGGEARDTMRPYIDAVDSYLHELSVYLTALSKR